MWGQRSGQLNDFLFEKNRLIFFINMNKYLAKYKMLWYNKLSEGTEGISRMLNMFGAKKEVINMKIIVTGKNITISEKIQEAIDKKFAKLGKYFADDIEAKVVIHPEKAKVKMETTILTKGTIFRAEDVEQDVFDCIDVVADKLLSQLTKYKGKLMKRNKSKESVRFEMIPEVEPQEMSKLVKTKKLQLIPMSVEEALLQMELLQHDFFVYLDVDTNTVNVVYKRNDKDYGVLETEQ